MRTVRHDVGLRADGNPKQILLIAPETGLRLTYAQLGSDTAQPHPRS